MRFLHIITNNTGISSSIRRAQRENNHTSDVEELKPYNLITRIWRLITCRNRYDTFYFHDTTCTDSGIDVLLWKLLGKKIILHYYDNYDNKIYIYNKPFYHKFANVIFVSTPNSIRFIPTAIWLPEPIFISDYPKKINSDTTIITHESNTDNESRLLNTIIFQINNENFKINLNIINKEDPDEIIKLSESTIMIDNVLNGWYKKPSLECMAMKIPVMCYIKPNLIPYIGKPQPLYPTDINTLDLDIMILLTDEKLRNKIADAGYNYVSTLHDPKRLVNYIISRLQKTT
jgi:hypothetical protein